PRCPRRFTELTRDSRVTLPTLEREMMSQFDPPKSGDPIRMSKSGTLEVPDHPIVPFIEGDGTGPDIWRAAVAVLDAAVKKAYAGKRQIAWYEVYAGEKSKRLFDNWL